MGIFSGRIVLDKLDLNVPVDGNGKITDAQKIREAVRSIQWCFANGARIVVVLSHQGRKKEESLKKHCAILEKYFDRVIFAPRAGKEAIRRVTEAPEGAVVVLENMRGDDEEKQYGDVAATSLYETVAGIRRSFEIAYVKDDFAVCHRSDLSIRGLPMQLRSEGCQVVAGPIMKQELDNVRRARECMQDGNVICIWGGKKFEDYMHLFQTFLEKYPNSIVMTSGPLSILMQRAMGRDVGQNAELFGISDALVAQAAPIVKKYKGRVLTPVDYYASNGSSRVVTQSRSIDGIIVDLGPKTVELYSSIINENPNSVIVGNGPLGQYEVEENRKGTAAVYGEVFRADNKNFVVGGGGDFNAVMNVLGFHPDVASTGGKAFLECIVNGYMPGLEPLETAKVRQ